MEIWKPVKDFEGLYEVSNQGRVKSVYRAVSNGMGFRVVKERILKPKTSKNGYMGVVLSRGSKGKSIRVHRIVADAFIPNIFGKNTVNHKDGDKANNKLENLEWATHAENAQHAIDNGLKKPVKGERHGKTNLTKSDVLEIKKLLADGMMQKDVASKFGVTRKVIGDIHRRRTWKHV